VEPQARYQGRSFIAGRELEQWQIKVSDSDRILYLPDDQAHTVWVVYASPAHPKETE
jgi:hypothetical protein